MRHPFPGNCLHGLRLSHSLCLSSLSCISLSTHDLLLPSPQLHHDDLHLSITPTQRRCAVERCIDYTRALCNKEQQRHCTIRYIFSHVTFHAISGFMLKENLEELQTVNILFYTIYEHTLDAHYKFTWYRFVDGKPSLYMANYMPSTYHPSVNKPLQLRDMRKPALSVETLLVPAISQLARLQTKCFQSNEKDIRSEISRKLFDLEYFSLNADWLFQMETFIQQV